MPTTIRSLVLAALAATIAMPAGAQTPRKRCLMRSPRPSRRSRSRIAENRGYAVSAVVVDHGGNTVVAMRADGASVHTMENARRKAYTAMTFKMSTEEFIKEMANRPVGASRPRCRT